jgi:hypothetical protein
MQGLLELLKENKTKELWRRCCGFIDLDMEQFMAIQHRLLLEQIELLKKCELGEKVMRGAKPRSVEEFREQVPLTTYGNYMPYLSEKREVGLPEKPMLWQRTSGRSSEYSCKWVPFTERMYRELGDACFGIMLLASCTDREDINLEEHDKLLYALAPPPYASGCWGRRMVEEKIFDFMPPVEEAEKMEFQERIEEGFKMGMTQGIDIMFAIASVLVAVGERLGQGGSFKKIFPLLNKPRVLMRLSKAIIKSKLAGRPLLPKDIWPLKALISTGTDSNIYREKMKNMWGKYPLDAYGCCEGVIIATQTWDYDSMTFLPNINFLEFIPENEHTKWVMDTTYRPKIMTLDEVVPGRRYLVAITNFLGGAFVRYLLGDVVTITSLRNDKLNINIPQMTFYGRADDIIDFEAFTHAFFTEKMIWEGIANSGFEYADWVARKEALEDMPILHLYIEPKGSHIYGEEEIEDAIHEQLKILNEDYQDLEKFFGFKPLKVTLLPEGAFMEYIAQKRAAGADLAHIKPPHMNPSDSILETLRACKVPAISLSHDSSNTKIRS